MGLPMTRSITVMDFTEEQLAALDAIETPITAMEAHVTKCKDEKARDLQG